MGAGGVAPEPGAVAATTVTLEADATGGAEEEAAGVDGGPVTVAVSVALPEQAESTSAAASVTTGRRARCAPRGRRSACSLIGPRLVAGGGMNSGAVRLLADVSTDATAPVRIDLWADIACPWCYLGSARLDEVLAERAAAGETVVVRHRPFELNPGMPPEGVPMAGFLEARFGSADAVKDAHARLTEMGRELGLAYDFAAVGKAPSTRLAHHVLQTYDGDARQHAAVRALYRAYFERGLDVTDAATIVSVVAEATAETADDVRARLDSPTDALDAAFALGRELGVSAVPTFVADAGTDVDPEAGLSAAAVAVQGAQPHEVLAQVIDEARRRATA